jgi:heme exporter protein D
MLPELGRYAFAVLASYGVTVALLAGLVLATFSRAARVKRRLAEVERSRGLGDRRSRGRP